MSALPTAFALFVVLFFMGATRKKKRAVAYPLVMTFTLVYSGEHYMIDVLVGWAYVGMTFLVVGLAERWWAARRAQARLRPRSGRRSTTTGDFARFGQRSSRSAAGPSSSAGRCAGGGVPRPVAAHQRSARPTTRKVIPTYAQPTSTSIM